MKNQKAITLIALVITIIILIILAGISISLTIGEEGIITKSKKAKEDQKIASLQESLEIVKTDVQLEKKRTNITLEEYFEEIKKGNKLFVDSEIIDEYIEKGYGYITLENKYVFLLEYQNKNIKITYKGIAGDVEIIAQVLVNYNVDNDVVYQVEKATNEECLNVTTFTPTKEGYEFVGWREDTEAKNEVLTSKIAKYEKIDLYAVFKKSITLSYDGNESTEGEVISQTEYKYYNNGNELAATFVLAENSFSKTDNKWIAWAEGSLEGTQYINGDTVSLKEDTIFYAYWEQIILYLVKDGAITELGQEWFKDGKFTSKCSANWRSI